MSGTSRIGSPGARPAAPAPLTVLSDLRNEGRARLRAPFPPGTRNLSVRNTWRFRRNVLGLLLENYERHGPIFGMRVLFGFNVFLIGPEANHFVLVSGRENFGWRHGHMGSLIPLIGDGLLTTDGDYHDASREIMMPAFHRERVVMAADAMAEEASAAVGSLERRAGQEVDVYHWTRELAMRIAMRSLFGFDPDSAHSGEVATTFERGLSFHGRDYPMQLLVGPWTPHAQMGRDRAALERIVGAEIRRRRKRDEDGTDILGSLLAATDEEGNSLNDQQVLDHVLTLLFAGHDTTTSTISFLVYELARNPDWAARLSSERDDVCGEREPTAEELFGGMPLLTRAIDETLRLYPPAWTGPRRAVRDFEFAGVRVPAGLPCGYSSWVSHHLPDVFEDPGRFDPDRFLPELRARWPRGAYVPFGMGPRVCIGKRFGYTEVHAIAAALLSRFSFELPDGYELEIQQAPTLSPRGGLPVRLMPR
ncbi:MAG: cytochrome P450 [Actinomycetota bacterium]|nr:cytochrome P450 [Actinomycetota bacterium]